MKNKIVLSFFFILNLIYVDAQSSYEAGYFVNNVGNKVECFLKVENLIRTPQIVNYQLKEGSEILQFSPTDVREFEINGKYKFISRKVNIDRSSEDLSNLSKVKDPEFKEDQLFLQLLISGSGNLYYYEEPRLKSYFFETEETALQELVNKSYEIEERKLGENTEYRNQLKTSLKCKSITETEINTINCNKKELVELFKKYNTCKGKMMYDDSENEFREKLTFTIRPGIRQQQLMLVQSTREIVFPDQINFRIGIELEYLLNLNRDKRKLSLIFEPVFQYYKAEEIHEIPWYSIDYKTINFTTGLRYYLLQTSKHDLFINGAIQIGTPLASSGVFLKEVQSDEMRVSNNFALGIGYCFASRLKLEFRVDSKRDVVAKGSSEYNGASLIVGYQINRTQRKK